MTTEVINQTEYVYVEYALVQQKSIDEFKALVEKYLGFIRMSDFVKGSWFTKCYMKMGALIPAKDIFNFYNEWK